MSVARISACKQRLLLTHCLKPSIATQLKYAARQQQQQWFHRSFTSASDEMEVFRQELKEVMKEQRENQSGIAKTKYEAWKLQQEQKAAEQSQGPKTAAADEERGEVMVDAFGPQDTHFNIGVRARDEEEMKKLIATMEESLKLQLLASPYASLPIAKSYEELGMLCHQCLDFTKAIKYYRHALKIHEKLAAAKINESDKVIDLSSNPVSVRGNPTKATATKLHPVNIESVLAGERSVFEQTTSTYSRTESSEEGFRYSFVTETETGATSASPTVHESVGSFDAARCLGYLGVCYRDAGKHEKAKEILLASLRMKYSTVGQYHESTAEALNNLGALYHALGDFQEAADCYEDSIRILIGALGGASTTSPYVAMAYYNLGVALRANGQLPQAIVALSKANRVSGAGQGGSHSMTQRIQQELGDVKNILKEHEEEQLENA